jgi:hypothetical protein
MWHFRLAPETPHSILFGIDMDESKGSTSSDSSTAFDAMEHPTSPRSPLLTSTNRWRAVANAALSHGFGRLSEGEFDEGTVPEPAPSSEPALEQAAKTAAPPEEPSVIVNDALPPLPVAPPVEIVGSPRAGVGPRGTVRIRDRRAHGPTGTLRMRARMVAPTGAPVSVEAKNKHRVLTVGLVAGLCAILGTASYGRDDRPAPETKPASVALPEAPAIPPAPPPMVFETMPDEVTADTVPTEPPPASVPPTKRTAPHAGSGHRHPTKASVL